VLDAHHTLADKWPDQSAGIYPYDREGFGRFAGFQMAWGYWLSAAVENVAVAVLVMQTFGHFFPVFGNGRPEAVRVCIDAARMQTS